MTLMKRNYNFLLLVLLLAFASCSFTAKKIDGDNDRDKLLIELLTYVVEEGHFSPKAIDDSFSKNVYDDFLKQIDPFKRYFLKSDIKEFDKYKTQIDDQLKSYDVTFFNLVHKRLLKRQSESKSFYEEILSSPFNFKKKETYNSDLESLQYVSSKKNLKERWRQQLKFSTISNYHDILKDQEETFNTALSGEGTAKSAEKKSLQDIERKARKQTLTSMNELFSFINERRREDWFSVYINTVVEEFDPHTAYLAPTDRDRFDFQMSGQLEGIGAQLQKRIDKISIVSLVSGGPAWRQNKLQVGDIILKVRQENEDEAVSVVGMRLDDAIKLIKGPKGTKVTLTLKKTDGSIKDLTITRDIVEQEETYAKTSIVEKNNNKFGVINLPGFYADFKDYDKRNAAADVKKEITRLKEQGMEGLVLDLRNNGGGSLKTVVDMAGLFIEDGPVVQVRATGEPKQVISDKDKSIIWDGPLVILVNELSASASEILAAAMQDYKRAIIIGSKQTYGKGTVQQYIDLNRLVKKNKNGDMGGFKYTTQKYYRINGGSTQLEGVKSDVVVPDRFTYIDIGEKDQDNPLPWDEITPASYKKWDNYFDYDATIKASTQRMQKSEQLQLIDENAKWIKKIRDKNTFSLNYEQYKNNLTKNEKESEKFNKIINYQTNLSFKSLPYETALTKTDTILKEKRKRWHQSLSKDVYVEEALNVLYDLKTSYSIKKVARLKD